MHRVSPGGSSATTTPAAGGKRDLRLDLLRGLCVLLMLVGHMGWYKLTSHFRIGWTTAAEGFFFLSGATLGTVWNRYRREGRHTGLERRLLLRAVWLWVANTALVLLAYQFEGTAAFPGHFFGRYWRDTPFWQQLVSLNQPSVLHILPRYSILLLLAPIVLRLLASRLAPLVWLLSLGLWWLHFQDPDAMRLYLLEARRRAAFPMASWQLLFYGGMAIATLAARRAPPPEPRRPRPVGLIVTAFAALALLTWLRAADLPGAGEALRAWVERQGDRATLGLVRLANFALAAFAFWSLVDRWRDRIVRAAGWLLLPLGQNALAAFLLHIPCLWLMNLVPWGADTTWLRLATMAAITVSIARLVTVPRVRKLLAPV